MYQNGKVYHRKAASWLSVFHDELVKFPSGKFADQVDVLAYAGQLATTDQLLRAAMNVGGSLVYGHDPVDPEAIQRKDSSGGETYSIHGVDVHFDD